MIPLLEANFARFRDKPDLRGSSGDMARGSANQMPLGEDEFRPWKGLTAASPTLGSRRMFLLKSGYGGLDDASAQIAAGSLFSSIAETLPYVGHGQVSVNGVNIPGAIATSLLRALLKWNGSYTHANSGPFVLGLPEPSAPTVGSLSNPPGGTPSTLGTYSFKIARIREITGGKSRASGTSPVLTLNGKGAYIVIPTASSGQTHHPIFVTTAGLGGLGLHYRIPKANPYTLEEYTEEDVQRTIATLSVTNASAVVTSSVSSFTAADVGKLFEAVSVGFSVPAGTTVVSVDSATQITLSNNVTVSSGSNPRSAELIFYTNEIERAVPLNWLESDLAGEAAEISWIYDFPPPSASHAFQIENRIAVATYADATANSDATHPGTALVFSLSNQLESFDVRFPLYLPEALVDIIGRGVDSYSFVGLRNGIYAVQYIDSPYIPATVSVILPNEGIQNANNWAITKRGLYICTGDGKFARVIENGQVDTLFYEPIRRFIRHWTQSTTVVVADAKNDGVIFANGAEVFYYDEMTGRVSTPLFASDFANGSIISGVGAASQAYLTLESAGTRTAYKFDVGSGSFVASVSPYKNAKGEAQMIVQEITAQMVADRTDKTAYVGLHRNNLATYVDNAAMTNGSNILTSSTAQFSSEYVGCHILIKGAGSAGAWLLGRIKSVDSATQVRIGTITESLSDSVNLNASTTISGKYALIAFRLFPVAPNRKGTIQVKSPEIFINECFSLAASVLMETAGTDAQPLSVEINGTETGEQWTRGGGDWGASV